MIGDGGGPVCYGDAMSAALKPMTMDEFLAWEECQEERFEFDGFRPVAWKISFEVCRIFDIVSVM